MTIEYVYSYMHPSLGWVYIGRTNNLKVRIATHDSDKSDNISREYEDLLKECSVFYLELPSKQQTIIVEEYLIDKYKPVLNKKSKTDIVNDLELSIPYKWNRYYREFEIEKILNNQDSKFKLDLESAKKEYYDLIYEKEKTERELNSLIEIKETRTFLVDKNIDIDLSIFKNYRISYDDIEFFYREYPDTDICFDFTVYSEDYNKNHISINANMINTENKAGLCLILGGYFTFTCAVPSSITYYFLMYEAYKREYNSIINDFRNSEIIGIPNDEYYSTSESKYNGRWFHDVTYDIDVCIANNHQLLKIENRKLEESHVNTNYASFDDNGQLFLDVKYEKIKVLHEKGYLDVKNPKDTIYKAKEYFKYFNKNKEQLRLLNLCEWDQLHIDSYLKKINYYFDICKEIGILDTKS